MKRTKSLCWFETDYQIIVRDLIQVNGKINNFESNSNGHVRFPLTRTDT